jgi:fatty-acyl-CoA synthase
MLDAIATQRLTLTVQVPVTLQGLQASPRWAETDLSSLRAVTTGSTDVPLALITAYHARGVPVIQVYGTTETGPVASYLKIPGAFATAGSNGSPGPHTAIRLVAPDGGDCAPGTAREILIRGIHVIHYWQGANPEAFTDGWLCSGDLAGVDPDGRYWFCDRLTSAHLRR